MNYHNDKIRASMVKSMGIEPYGVCLYILLLRQNVYHIDYAVDIVYKLSFDDLHKVTNQIMLHSVQEAIDCRTFIIHECERIHCTIE